MNRNAFWNILRDEDPPTESGGGGGGGGTEETAPKVETDGEGNPVIDQSTKAIETAPKFDSASLFNDEGVMSDGRFDVEDHKFTAEFLEEHPHVAKLLESNLAGQKKITEFGQGKIELGEALEDSQILGLSFDRNEDGTLPKATTEMMLNRPVTQNMLDLYADLMDMAQDANRSANSVWWQEQYERIGGGSTGDGQSKFIEMQNWAKDPNNMAAETAAEITAALKMHTMRPHAIAQLEAAYDAKNADHVPANPLKPGNFTPGDVVPDTDDKGKPKLSTGQYYAKEPKLQKRQFETDLMAAGNDHGKRKLVNDKIARTMAHFNQIVNI